MISLIEVADALEAGLTRASADVELEQAPHGLDARAELALHPLLARALVDAGFHVAREQRYPSDRAVTKKRNVGKRCDLVVTKGGPLESETAQGELFDTEEPVPLDDALWLEVKVLAQFGAGGPNRGWTRSLLAPPTADIAKLANEPLVRERALAIVLFTQSHDIAAHDLDVWHEHVQQKGLALQPVTLRHVVIGDRRGNAFCSVGLFEVARNFDVDGAEMEA